MSKNKTLQEINEKIKKGKVRVLRADEMTGLVRQIGPEEASEIVDIVTTGTFGAMCSSGVWLNFGHSEPPIKMTRVWINNVEAYTGVAAVDAYLGATQPSEDLGISYGGAHVIEDLLRGKPVILRAVSYGTDCYPRKEIITRITLDDLNSAVMSNPRNAYQRYNAATNSRERPLHTYMGKLLPHNGNVTFSGAGELSPLINDPELQTIGIGTKIFLGGAQGFVIGAGTQHNPQGLFSTLMVQGNLKDMSTEFIRAATFSGYGCTLYVGIGIPIPVINAEIARKTAISDEEIQTKILDYSVPSRNRPALKTVTYAELKSGWAEVNGKKARTSPLSSLAKAREIAEILKTWIVEGFFTLTSPVVPLPTKTNLKTLEELPADEKELEFRYKPKANRGLTWCKELCIHCGHCLSICPSGVIERNSSWYIQVNPEKCTSCGECEEVCPVGALRFSF